VTGSERNGFPSLADKIECLFLSLTGRCQLSCFGCLFNCTDTDLFRRADVGEKEGSPVSPHSFKQLISEMTEMNISKLKFGYADEPLLHTRIADFAALAYESGIDVGITTNGIDLTPSLSEDLIRAGVTSIIVSRGMVQSRSEVRSVDESIESVTKAEDGLKNLLVARDKFLKKKKNTTKVFTTIVTEGGLCEVTACDGGLDEVSHFIRKWEGSCDGIIVNSFLQRSEPLGGIVTRNPRIPLPSRKPCMSPFKELYLMHDSSTFCCVPAVVDCLRDKASRAEKSGHLWNLGSWKDVSLRELAGNLRRKKLQRVHQEERYDDVDLCHNCMAWCQHYPKTESKGNVLMEETSFWSFRRMMEAPDAPKGNDRDFMREC